MWILNKTEKHTYFYEKQDFVFIMNVKVSINKINTCVSAATSLQMIMTQLCSSFLFTQINNVFLRVA